MSKLKLIDTRKMEKLLLAQGFVKVSHAFYRHPDGRTSTLPRHKGSALSHVN